MDTKDFISEVNRLNADINKQLLKSIETFENNTGVNVADIEVTKVDVTAMSSAVAQCHFSIRAKINI